MGNPIDPISAIAASAPSQTPEPPIAAPRQSVTPPHPTTTPSLDTVDVSLEARARLLNTQGESLSEIANNLNVTPKDVVSYLGKTQLEAQIESIKAK